MKLFNFNKQKEQPIQEPKKLEYQETFHNVELRVESNLPRVVENKSKQWVEYLTDDNREYLSFLEQLYTSSPTHSSIVSTKSLLTAGDGFTYNDTLLSDEQKLDLNKMLNFIDGKNDMSYFLNQIAKDNIQFGVVAIEVIWSLDFTKIVKATRIHPKHIRSGLYEDGEIKQYFYSRNWENRREEIVPIPAFDVNDKENGRQLIYIGQEMDGNDYYFTPQWSGSINWVALEAQMGLYYTSLLQNGFNPSMMITLFNNTATPEEKDNIARKLVKSFAGLRNTGKAFINFAKDKETAPEIKPIDVSNLDKQYIVLAEQITQKILTGHKVTTTELFGVSTPGSLGSGDFATQVKVFQDFVITPNQKFIEGIVNKLFKVNGLFINFQITPYEITKINTEK